jgi:hypothetical protein
MTSAFITFPFLTNPDSIRETIILRGNRAAKIFSTQEAAVNYCKSMNQPECSPDGVQWDWEELDFHG